MANCAAVSADTSSAAAGTTPVVGIAAAAFCAATAVPIPRRSAAAAVSSSGRADTKDIETLLEGGVANSGSYAQYVRVLEPRGPDRAARCDTARTDSAWCGGAGVGFERRGRRSPIRTIARTQCRSHLL